MNKKEEKTEEAQEVKVDLSELGFAFKAIIWFGVAIFELAVSYILLYQHFLPALQRGYWFLFYVPVFAWVIISFVFILLVHKVMKWIGGQKILEKID